MNNLMLRNPKKQKNITLDKHTLARPARGFVMLYAILITTVILVIGLSFLDILVEQVSLTGVERESTAAFYSGDSGLECALYWDLSIVVPPEGAFRAGSSISCNGASITPTYTSGTPSGGFRRDTYDFSANFSQGGCAAVTVEKTIMLSTDTVASTTIRSRGYNTACPPIASAKPWRFERGIKVDY